VGGTKEFVLKGNKTCTFPTRNSNSVITPFANYFFAKAANNLSLVSTVHNLNCPNSNEAYKYVKIMAKNLLKIKALVTFSCRKKAKTVAYVNPPSTFARYSVSLWNGVDICAFLSLRNNFELSHFTINS
jgi:hypothetical protein